MKKDVVVYFSVPWQLTRGGAWDAYLRVRACATPAQAKLLPSLPVNVDGTLDMTSADVTKFLRNVVGKVSGPTAHSTVFDRYPTRSVLYSTAPEPPPPPPRLLPPFEQEISRRKYPLALRPQIVKNKAGASMRWEDWLRHPKITEVAELIFEDGHTVRAP
jgi:hypothetical protein